MLKFDTNPPSGGFFMCALYGFNVYIINYELEKY